MHETTIAEMGAALDSGTVTSAELVERCLARIRAYDGSLRAVLYLNPSAEAEADRLDAERRRDGPRGSLHGIPVLIKDNFATFDMPTTGACVALEGLVLPEDAFVVRRLREAGAVLLAKTNLHELASGLETISSLGGQTRNPYDLERCAGGSSGGTAAGVAASFGAIGYGTDTRGSIRLPAALTSLWGLRPSFGRFSVAGVIPLSHSQDTVGPLARTVADLAVGLDVLEPTGPSVTPRLPSLGGRVQPDPRADHATRARAPYRAAPPPPATAPAGEFAAALATDALRGARIGLLDALFDGDGTEPDVVAVVRDALAAMQGPGAVVVTATIPDFDALLDGTDLIDHEFKFDIGDFLAAAGARVRSLGEIVDRGLCHPALEAKFRRRNEPGSRDTEAYRAALAKRDEMRRAVLEAMDRDRLDALAYPVVRCRPAPLGDEQSGSTAQLSASTGMPAIAMPAGYTSDGLPVGVELLGRPGADATLVGFAYAYEQAVLPRRAPDHSWLGKTR